MTTPVRTDRMPAGIPFIISNEFAERFCYYGINSILVVYMIQFMHFGDAEAQSWQAMFKSAAYFFPLLGAMVSDIFLAKFRTIIYFSMVYVVGCTTLAFATTPGLLVLGMFLTAFGTGGIKPCVSTNVGDQFTTANQHLIERAFSYFYFSINAGSSISIYFCPELLANPAYGPKLAFGMPAVMMAIATLVFWLGRKRFAVVPAAMDKPGLAPLAFIAVFLAMMAIPAVLYTSSIPGIGHNFLVAVLVMFAEMAAMVALCLNTGLRNALPAPLVQWLETSFTGDNLRTVGRLLILYIFIALFWALWDQSNGNSWTVQAQSGLMDKHLFGFLGSLAPGLASYEMLPAQLQVVNGLFILVMIPIFTFGVYPLLGKFFTVTPLRKIGIGFFITALSFLFVAWIENQIQSGYSVSLWWQILAYGVLSAAEVLVSITGLEYSYKQAPPVMKSFVMSLFLLAVSVGNALTATVNNLMVDQLHATDVSTGAQTWVTLDDVSRFVTGQKIDFDGATGIEVHTEGAKPEPLAGTFLVGEIDKMGKRLQLIDKVDRKALISEGAFDASKSQVSTYSLVGPIYFLFFAALMVAFAVVYVFVAMRFKEKSHVRAEGVGTPEAASESPPA
jgi:POT family proton-dependent oligopeptide transporter